MPAPLLVLLSTGLLAFVGVLVLGAVSRTRPTLPPLSTGLVLVPALAAMTLSAIAIRRAFGRAEQLSALADALTGALDVRVLSAGVVLPACLAALVTAATWWRERPWRPRLGTAVAAMGVPTALLALWHESIHGTIVSALPRAGLYLVLAGLLAASAREGARIRPFLAAGSAGFVLVVAGCEISADAWHWLQTFHDLASADATPLPPAKPWRSVATVSAASVAALIAASAGGARSLVPAAIGVLTAMLWPFIGDPAPLVHLLLR